MAQVRITYSNGVEVSVITDGYGSEQGLFEAMVWMPGGLGLTGLIPGGDDLGIYGWLDERKLGDLLSAADHLVV